jgi:hypothetical protein
VIRACGRLAGVSVAAQVSHHHKVILRQRWRDLAPQNVGLGDTMQQQEGRTVSVAAVDGVDRRAGGLDLRSLKALEEFLTLEVGFRLCTPTTRKQRSLGSGHERHRILQEFTAIGSHLFLQP